MPTLILLSSFARVFTPHPPKKKKKQKAFRDVRGLGLKSKDSAVSANRRVRVKWARARKVWSMGVYLSIRTLSGFKSIDQDKDF